MLNKDQLSRRSILKSIGITPAFMPFLPVLEQEVEAQGGVPKRFVMFFHPHGGLESQWDNYLARLNPVINDTIVFKGVRVNSRNANGASGGHHFHQMAAIFSGSENSGNANLANGQSIDHFIHSRIGDGSAGPLVTAVDANEANIRGRVSHIGPRQPATPQQNPRSLFRRLFSGIDPRRSRDDRSVNYEASVLDAVYTDLKRLQPRISEANYKQMQEMAENIRRMEIQFDPSNMNREGNREELELSGGRRRQRGCSAPRLTGGNSMNDKIDDFIDIISHAFQCRLTNVASLQILTSMVTSPAFRHLGIDDRLHKISHADSGQSVPNARNKMQTVVSYFYDKLATLALSLDVRESSTGQSLLDQSLILSCSELGMNSQLKHGSNNMPYVMIGKAGGGLRVGQTVSGRFDNNQVLVTAANAMGININRFGTLDRGQGAIRQALS